MAENIRQSELNSANILIRYQCLKKLTNIHTKIFQETSNAFDINYIRQKGVLRYNL